MKPGKSLECVPVVDKPTILSDVLKIKDFRRFEQYVESRLFGLDLVETLLDVQYLI